MVCAREDSDIGCGCIGQTGNSEQDGCKIARNCHGRHPVG
jgi:hypothetical protein